MSDERKERGTGSLERVVRPGDEPYFIEVDNNGCTCGSGRTWTIVGPDGVATGQSWGDEEEAAYICELLNDAYERGKGSNAELSGVVVSVPPQRK